MVSNLYNNHSASNEETSSCIDNYACIDNYEATHIVEFKFAIHLQSQLKILPCIIKYNNMCGPNILLNIDTFHDNQKATNFSIFDT